jgi:hypothetical protein
VNVKRWREFFRAWGASGDEAEVNFILLRRQFPSKDLHYALRATAAEVRN